MKSRVYSEAHPASVTDLKQRIQSAFSEITPDMLQKTMLAYKERLHCTVDRNGEHVENDCP